VVRRFYIPLLIGVATIAALFRVVNHRFTSWDDVSTIAYNTHLNPPTAAGLAEMWKQPHMGLYVPVTYTAWSAIAVLAHRPSDEVGIQLNPAFFHAANLIAHTLAACVAFALLRRLVGNDWAAAAGALLFALHPVQVEAVAWTSGFKDVLCGLFTLIALWQYVLYASDRRRFHSMRFAGSALRTISSGSRRTFGRADPTLITNTQLRTRLGTHYRLATLAFVLAMLSKPTAMAAPLMALTIHLLLLRRPMREAMKPLSLWFALALICGLIARFVQPGTGVDSGPIFTRPIIAGDALTFYLGQILWPQRLGIDYGHTPTAVLRSSWSYLFCLVPAIAMGVALRRMNFARDRRMLLGAAALLVIPLLPVLGFVPFMFQAISTVADHYLYFAMLGPALLLAWMIRRIPMQQMRVTCAVMLVACGVRSFIQTSAWQDDFKLYRQAIATNPHSAVGYNNLAQAYQMHHDLPTAERYYTAAIEVQPMFQPARQNLGACLAYEGKIEAAIVQLREAQRLELQKPLERRQDMSDAFYGLGEILQAGHHDEDAARLFAELLRQKPDDRRALARLKELHAGL
jgi:hypothetical protein